MSLRLKATILPKRATEQALMARVYRDADWSEYRVKFFRQGQHMVFADYHTADLTDALETARSTLEGLNEPVLIHADRPRDIH